MRKALLVIIVLGLLAWAEARTFVIVEDSTTARVEYRGIVELKIERTDMVTAPDDPNYFEIKVRIRASER